MTQPTPPEHPSLPGASGAAPDHPWSRFISIGDSFTEGVGDDDPQSPNGVRGWADRVAEELGASRPDFAYANLAVRGKLIDQIADEQVDAAIELAPDLITVCAGGNDLIRVGANPDAVAARFERIIDRLVRTDATIVIFTGVDTKFSTAAFRLVRSSVAIYNEHLRGIADRYGLLVADQWNWPSIQDSRMWSTDRLHLNPMGHHEVARLVLDVLGVPSDLEPLVPAAQRPRTWRQARLEDAAWIRDHVVPWVGRRLRHVSSGDQISPKRPIPEPILPLHPDTVAAGADSTAIPLHTDEAGEPGSGSGHPHSPR